MNHPLTVDEALRQPGQVLAAWDLEVVDGSRELTVYDLSGGGARPLVMQRVALQDVTGVNARLVADGHATGAYDGHRAFVWRETPGMVEVWSATQRELHAQHGVIVDGLGRRHPVDTMAAMVGYVEIDRVDRGIKLLDVDGKRRTLCFELSAHAAADPTYGHHDLLNDTLWIAALGSALARWAGVPYRDEVLRR